MAAAWFVSLIKARIGFFPFLSFYGDPQTGKTVLTRRLNACQCLDEEGLPMRKINTGKGEIRKLAQRSGLFKALLENNNEETVRFDMDSILTLYNENPLQVRALKTNDIQTQEIPFLSSLLFVQNKEPFKTKAQKERVISVRFEKKDNTDQSAKALNELIQISISQLAYFFPFVMAHRKRFEHSWFDEFQQAKSDLNIQDARINSNHAIVLGFHRILSNILEVNNDLRPYLERIGIRKQKQCLSREETTADLFFSIIDRFRPDDCWFLDKEDDSTLCLHLYGALQKIKDEGIAFSVPYKDLQKDLAAHPAFITNKPFRFTMQSGQSTHKERKKAWFFDLNKIHED